MGVQKTITFRRDVTEVINMDVAIVYGDVLGNVVNCKEVIIINGDVRGNITGCKNLAGLLADITDTN